MVSVVLLLVVVVVLLVVDSVVDVEEEEVPAVPVLVEPDIPLLEPPRAREDRAEATAAEAACARPPARLLFIAPIMGGVMDAGTIAVGSILKRYKTVIIKIIKFFFQMTAQTIRKIDI